MILKRVAQNKYKLIAAILIVWLAVDACFHKGMVRVLLPKDFPQAQYKLRIPIERNFSNGGKNWVKAVNSVERMRKEMSPGTNGMECDVYFDTVQNIFDVHHDADNSTGLDLGTLLDEYQRLQLKARIWLDFKNLDSSNTKPALKKLLELTSRYRLWNKVLVESGKAKLLNDYHNAGFYTSYYVPLFNPYLINDDSLKHWAATIAKDLEGTAINALSGYYFQYPFLAHYFPTYDILTWATKDTFSPASWLFRRKLGRDKRVFIVLYP